MRTAVLSRQRRPERASLWEGLQPRPPPWSDRTSLDLPPPLAGCSHRPSPRSRGEARRGAEISTPPPNFPTRRGRGEWSFGHRDAQQAEEVGAGLAVGGASAPTSDMAGRTSLDLPPPLAGCPYRSSPRSRGEVRRGAEISTPPPNFPTRRGRGEWSFGHRDAQQAEEAGAGLVVGGASAPTAGPGAPA